MKPLIKTFSIFIIIITFFSVLVQAENRYIQAYIGSANNNLPNNLTANVSNDLYVKKMNYSYGAGVGYYFKEKLRIDVTYNYFGKQKIIANQNVVSSSSDVQSINSSFPRIKVSALLVNASYDIIKATDSIIPYITAGIGLGAINAILIKYDTQNTAYTSKSYHNSTRIAYQYGFGVNGTVSDHFNVDLGLKVTKIDAISNTNIQPTYRNIGVLATFRFCF